MSTLDSKGQKPGTKAERWVVIYRGEKRPIFSEGFAVFWSMCCGACKHTWGHTFEGEQIIFCGVTGKDVHHTSAGPYSRVHFIELQMQMWEDTEEIVGGLCYLFQWKCLSFVQRLELMLM